MSDISHDQLDVARVWRMMAEIKICMLVTHDGAALRARPMEACVREQENAVYFLTERESPKHQQIGEDDHVCLAFATPNEGKFLSVSGEARLLNDRPLIRALWKPEYQAFWRGPEDPAVLVLEVVPAEAQLWRRPGGLIGAVGMIAARAVGELPELGDERKVDLH